MTLPLRPVTYLINHGLELRRATALLRAGFSTVAEIEFARDMWRRTRASVSFSEFLRARDVGEHAASSMLHALDIYQAGVITFPSRWPFEQVAAQYRGRVLDGSTPHWTPLGDALEIGEREGLSPTSTNSLLRLLSYTGFAVKIDRTVYAVDPRIPYTVEWAESVPEVWRKLLRGSAELLRHNVTLCAGWRDPFPLLALNGVGEVEWDHDLRIVRILTVDGPAVMNWQPEYWLQVSRSLAL
jgi:hypothetical protein